MKIKGWKYYNHAAIPTCAPHENPDLKPIKNGSIWKLGGGGGHYSPLLARWTTDWDCGFETNWWYVIKDTPFDINALKSKRRYEINKGNKNFRVERLTILEKYVEQFFIIARKAFSVWPEKYRPTLNKEIFAGKILQNRERLSVFGAFDTEDNLCGYACLIDYENYSDFWMLKVDPDKENTNVNFALVYYILCEYNEKLQKANYYICDGSRVIRHQTHFQDYLEKYFGFRKAYCSLHVKYRWFVKMAIYILKPFNNILLKSHNPLIYNVSTLIKMDSMSVSSYS